MVHTHIQYLYLLQKTHDSYSSYASTCFDSKNVEQVSHILADPVTDPPFSQCYIPVLYIQPCWREIVTGVAEMRIFI